MRSASSAGNVGIYSEKACTRLATFIRLRQNILQLAAGMNGKANAPKLFRAKAGLASANFALIPRSLLRGASLIGGQGL